jgi:hypothetical protein
MVLQDDDVIFDWVLFSGQMGLFCAWIPGKILTEFHVQRSIFLGGFTISFTLWLLAQVVRADYELITMNSHLITCTLCFFAC